MIQLLTAALLAALLYLKGYPKPTEEEDYLSSICETLMLGDSDDEPQAVCVRDNSTLHK